MSKHKLDRSELESHLDGQRRRLKRAVDAYDQGDAYAIAEVATVLRLLMSESRSMTPLLGQLDLLKKPFFDTSAEVSVEMRERGSLFFPNYAAVTMSEKGSITFVPAATIEKPKKRTAFPHWWSAKDCKLVDLEFSREDMVRMVADKMGAHVDPVISIEHHMISTGVGAPWKITTPWGEAPLPDLEKASVRSIAEEVAMTLDHYVGPLNRDDA